MTVHPSAWQARGRWTESELEVVVGAIVWKVLGTSSGIVAAAVARRLVASGWTAATGKEPPANPEDPEVSWPEAVGWALASGAVIAVARLLATRKAAVYYTRSAGRPPKGLHEAG
jgi:Protein of unknown function (DUF4235)